jgi:hypothetical protein
MPASKVLPSVKLHHILRSLDLHNKTRVALANLRRNIHKNHIKKQMSPNLVMNMGSVCLLISQLDT